MRYKRSQVSGPSGPCALWTVDLKVAHLDWNPEATLIHFQGQYLTICELDYNILQGEIQNIPKTKAAVDIGEFCLVEDLTSAHWYRGRVQDLKEGLFDVFLIDHGNVLSVDIGHISSCSNDLFLLPPKIVCGFLANVLLLHGCSHSVMEGYLSSLVGRNITGHIQALLPHKVLLLEAPDINNDLVRHGFGRHVDTNTFLLLVEMLTEVPLKQNIDPVPDLLIEKPRGQEYSYRLSRLQGYEEILSICGPRLSCGVRAIVRVTAAVNPGLFYCQMISMEKDLCEMSKKLAEFCEHTKNYRHQKSTETLGPLCSVKSKDGKWYRGFVQFLPVNSQVRVLLIDYGFFESVKVENVHRLPPDFYSTPIMTFLCSLSSLHGHDEALKNQQRSFLKAGLLGGVLDVEINSFDEEQHLYAITIVGAQDNNLKEPEPTPELPRIKVQPVSKTEELSPQGGLFYYETITSQEFGKTMEVEKVQVGSVFVGYVEYSQNPSNFWIRTQKRNEEFQEMMKQIADHFSQVKLHDDVLENPELGTLCCALHEEDMHFYRGIVIDTLEHGSEVVFIDFGNIEKVPDMLVKKIPETFAKQPAFALCCTLVNVVPGDEVWTCDTSNFFRHAVSNKALLVHIVHMRKHKFVVDLHEMGNDNSQSISELLVSSKQAEFWNNIPIKPVLQSKTDAIGKRSAASDIYEKTDWEDCEGQGNSSEDEIKNSQSPCSFKSLSIKPGCELAVRCSYISSPSNFWCQRQDEVSALKELMSKIQQFYATHKIPLHDGDLCCVAKSPEDGKWYRALITNRQQGQARVTLVDYGVMIQVKEQCLQKIIPQYTNLEGQAFRCSLYNLIEPTETKSFGDWNPETCNYLKKFSNDSTDYLKCKVFSQLKVKNEELYNVVDLYNTKTQQSIIDVLVGEGLAKEATALTKQMSAACPESFVYSSFDLNLKSEEQVFVTHLSSQLEVYCQIDRNMETIEKLEDAILEECEKMKRASMKGVVSKLCLAKYLDGRWYRGLVHAVQSPLHLSVFFVDYGNTNISEKTHVMFIPRDSDRLLYTPMQAVKFNLASVSKEELYLEVKEWIEGAVLNKQARAVIVGKNNDGSFDVELFDGDVSINQKVNELILSLSPKPKTAVTFACGDSRKRIKPSEKKGPKKQSRRPFPISATPHIRRGPCKKTSSVKSYVDVRYQMKTQKNSPPEEPKQRSDNKVEPPQLTETTQIPQLSCLPQPNVSAGSRVKCFVSHINSVCSFFLQLSDDEPAILKLIEELNSSASRDSLKSAPSVRVNDLVLAQYEEDGDLYRALVKEQEGSSFSVEFVDYGNLAVVKKENICSLPKKYFSQPRFSISCSLLDPNKYDSDASFTEAVMEKPLMVYFACQRGSHWEVTLEIIDGEVDNPATAEPAVETTEEVEATGMLAEMAKCKKSSLKDIDTDYRGEPKMTVEGELKPPPAVLSVKPKMKPWRPKRIRTINWNNPNKSQKRISKSSFKSALADIVTPLIIQAEDTENAIILSVLCNSEFYVRLNKTSDMLAALESLIAKNLCQCEKVPEEEVKQGLKCLVQLPRDKQWKRAVIQHVGQDKIQVFLVDDGLTEDISSDSLRRQCAAVMNVPNLAVLCKMSCCVFTPKLQRDTLKHMIGQEVKLVFVCYSDVYNLWMVELVMNQLFLIHQITAAAQIQSSGGTCEEAAEELTPNPSPRQKLVFAPVSIDKAYSGFAAAVTTPFEFCIVLEDLLLIMNKVSVMLDKLPRELSPLPEDQLTPGTCCLVQSSLKNKWCRAEIVQADTSVVLNLVDYGHSECVPYQDRSKLKMLPEDLRKLPKVTYPCILRGVKPAALDGQWTDEGTVFFQQRLFQTNLQIFFRELVSNTHWKVDILADGVHVAKELVDAGHASYIDIMLGLR
ncbi:tudor domain-containing protein 15 [Aulostomus maculatus]